MVNFLNAVCIRWLPCLLLFIVLEACAPAPTPVLTAEQIAQQLGRADGQDQFLPFHD